MDDQPWVDDWPIWDEGLSKITAAPDIAAAREKLARRFNRRAVRLPRRSRLIALGSNTTRAVVTHE